LINFVVESQKFFLTIKIFQTTTNLFSIMNKLRILALGFFLVFAFNTAQAKSDSTTFYAGKWDVLIKGTPNGDVVLPMTFAVAEGVWSATFTDPESKEEKKATSMEVKNGELNMAFSVAGYDVTMLLAKKDDDHANGKLMDMFDCEATRKKP
jgi:hypothetical protein